MSYSTPFNSKKPAQIPLQRILIVEDDPVMQLGLTQFFEEYPQFQIVGIAADGYTGIETAIKLQPHLAIAGHDKDLFARYPAVGTPEISVQRNAVNASYIDLPVMQNRRD